MEKPKFTRRVGLFVLAGLVLMAALFLSFSKGTKFFTPTYDIILRTTGVGGLKNKSAVFLAGVQVGAVREIALADGGRSVRIRLEILKKFPIHADARFVIEQIGVLGDQFVAIYAEENKAPLLQDGDVVEGREPFNLQEVARSTSGLIQRFEQLGKVVEDAVKRVNTQVLDAQTLSNFSTTIGNFRTLSENAIVLLDGVDALVKTNSNGLTESITNLVRFSYNLKEVAQDLDTMIQDSRPELASSLTNLNAASLSLRAVASDLEQGRGAVGGLLHDDTLRAQIAQTLANLNIATSNIARYGLLYKPKKSKDAPVPSPYPGKSGF